MIWVGTGGDFKNIFFEMLGLWGIPNQESFGRTVSHGSARPPAPCGHRAQKRSEMIYYVNFFFFNQNQLFFWTFPTHRECAYKVLLKSYKRFCRRTSNQTTLLSLIYYKSHENSCQSTDLPTPCGTWIHLFSLLGTLNN